MLGLRVFSGARNALHEGITGCCRSSGSSSWSHVRFGSGFFVVVVGGEE
jgi:hypothetical protein